MRLIFYSPTLTHWSCQTLEVSRKSCRERWPNGWSRSRLSNHSTLKSSCISRVWTQNSVRYNVSVRVNGSILAKRLTNYTKKSFLLQLYHIFWIQSLITYFLSKSGSNVIELTSYAILFHSLKVNVEDTTPFRVALACSIQVLWVFCGFQKNNRSNKFRMPSIYKQLGDELLPILMDSWCDAVQVLTQLVRKHRFIAEFLFEHRLVHRAVTVPLVSTEFVFSPPLSLDIRWKNLGSYY